MIKMAQQYVISKDNTRPQCDDRDNVLSTLRSLNKSDAGFIYLDKPFTLDNLHGQFADIRDLYTYCYERGYILNKAYAV